MKTNYRDKKGRFLKNHPSMGNNGKIYLPKEKLKELYINQKLSSQECAKILNCSQTLVLRNLKEYGIKIRSYSEIRKGKHFSPENEFKKGQKPNGGFKTRFKNGKEHPLWKGGISSLYDKIKQTNKYKLWRDEIYKRDYWTCQICGKYCKKGDIIAHHKKSFSEYPKLRFDINNGITLCRNCHAKIHNYHGSFIPEGELAICL